MKQKSNIYNLSTFTKEGESTLSEVKQFVFQFLLSFCYLRFYYSKLSMSFVSVNVAKLTLSLIGFSETKPWNKGNKSSDVVEGLTTNIENKIKYTVIVTLK